MGSRRRAIGYVPRAVSVDGSLTGYENLLIFPTSGYRPYVLAMFKQFCSLCLGFGLMHCPVRVVRRRVDRI